MRLGFLAPICNREKKKSDKCHLSTGGVPPCSRWGCRQTLHRSFPSLVGLSLSLTDAGVILISLQVLPLRRGGDAPRANLMESQTDVQFLTLKILLASDATQGAIKVTFQNASQAKTTGRKHSSPECLCMTLSIFLTTIRPVQT